MAPQTVGEIMSRQIVDITAESTIERALDLMISNHLSALPVSDSQGKCQGILSATDIIRAVSEMQTRDQAIEIDDSVVAALSHYGLGSVGEQKVTALMSAEIHALPAETSICEAAQRMATEAIHRLPVIDDAGRVVGIVSTMDITRVVGKMDRLP